MTLAVVGTPAVAGNATAITPTVVDGAVGDEIFWIVAWGFPAAASITDRPVLSGGRSASASHVGSVWGGGGTYGAGTGSRGLSVWRATATSTTGATDNTTFTLPGAASGVIGGYAVRVSKAAGTSILSAFTGGIDVTAGDTWAPTGFTDVGATTNDLLLHCTGSVPNASTPTAVLTWTGATLGAESNVATNNVSPGSGVRMNLRQRSVTSGTSTAAPSVAATTTGMTGVHGVLRLRESSFGTIPPVVTITGATPSAAVQNDTVPLRGTATDSDGTIAATAWTFSSIPGTVTAPAITNVASLTTASFKPVGPGTYVVRLTATDNDGNVAYVEKTITVTEMTAGSGSGGDRYVYTSTGWR